MSKKPDDKAQGLGGEGKRPYATLDLKATEIEERPAGDTASPDAAAAQVEPRPDNERANERANERGSGPGVEAAPAVAGGEKTPERTRSGMPVVTHLAAGVLGALAVLAAYEFGLAHRQEAQRQSAMVKQLSTRLADLEGAMGGKPGAEGMRTRLDELARSYTKLSETQGRIAADTRTLDQRIGGQEIPKNLAERLTKIDEVLATVPTPPGREPSPAAKALLTRVDGELSDLRTETGRLGQRIDTLRGEVDERLKGAARASDVAPLAAKVAAMEKDVQGFTKSEADRNANASRIVLLLELGNLKRALDGGRAFASELAAVQKVAGGRLDLAPLQRFATEGVPTVPELQKSFRRVANGIIDAEAEPNNASFIDRLVNGAKSVVRVRKQGHAPDDSSTEAVVGRMEAALKEARLAEVLDHAKTLPPKAALAGEEWLKKVQARQSVNAAIANIEQALKTSLGEAQR